MTRSFDTHEPPEGFRLAQDFLSVEEEKALLAEIEGLDFREVVMRGVAAKRTVRGYGWKYGFENWSVEPTDPLPEWLLPLRRRLADWAGMEAESLEQCLVSRYPAGAGIGWHRDALVFGPRLIGVSLRAHCIFHLRREVGNAMHIYKTFLPPRSVYLLSGPARDIWQHRIPPVKTLRYSLTFRTLTANARMRLKAGQPPP